MLAVVQYVPSDLVFMNTFVAIFDCIKCSVMDAQILMEACGYQHDFHVLGLP